MWWTNIIIISLLLQSLLIPGIDGNANRRRRRRQSSGSLYGTNANLGASAPAGYNYPADTNINGIRLNNADARDMYGNPLISSAYTQDKLNSVNYYDQPRPPIQQVYGNSESSLNSLYGGNSLYSGGGANQLFRDANGNILPSGSGTSSFYSSSSMQQAYPPITNQVLSTKDMYGTSSNTNNNPYGYNNNQLPNSNTYGGPMSNNNQLPNSNTYGGPMNNNNQLPNSNTYGGPMSNNNNLLPNSNTYGGPMGNNNNLPPNRNTYSGSMGSNTNLVPNSNSYSGYMGTGNNNNNLLPNTNSYYRYNQNSANAMYPNRDTNYNNNNNNRYSNPNPSSYYYASGSTLTTSIFIIFLSFLATIILRL